MQAKYQYKPSHITFLYTGPCLPRYAALIQIPNTTIHAVALLAWTGCLAPWVAGGTVSRDTTKRAGHAVKACLHCVGYSP